MKTRLFIIICILSLTGNAFGDNGQGFVVKGENGEKSIQVNVPPIEKSNKTLSKEALNSFLKSRTSATVFGGFHSYCNFLHATEEITIITHNPEIKAASLWSPFVEDYMPTWEAFMNMLARQVQARWEYNHKTGNWEFFKGPLAYPFEITVAEGWTPHDRGNYVSYAPPGFPVGMDIYMMGHYSAEEGQNKADLYAKARRHVALTFARNFKKDVTVADMQKTDIAGAEALYFTIPSPPKPQIIWRQWAFVKKGWCFLIASAIDKKLEDRYLPDVKKMIDSFKLVSANSG